ncbi:MAG: HNH endonuclease [Acidimicrobiia bacterium]
MFQANPDRYDALRDLEDAGDIDSWSIRRHRSDLTPGDSAVLWVAGRVNPGVYALGTVTGVPVWDVTSEKWIRPEDRGIEGWFCPLHFDRLLIDNPIPKEELFADPAFRLARIRTQPQAANPFLLSQDEWAAIDAAYRRRRSTRDHVSPERNPPWAVDELILALDLYLKCRPHLPDSDSSDVVELSRLLNSLPIHSVRPDAERFRNPNGVAMKLANFGALDPDFPGKGLDAGSKRDFEVWKRYATQPEELSRLAERIRAGAGRDGAFPVAPEDQEDEIEEGRLLFRLHRMRERDAGIVARKKAAVLRQTGRLACEICGFDFAVTYGELGEGYIECHHLMPLAESGRRRTMLRDLALLCSNCHRMVHKARPWKAPTEIATLLQGRNRRQRDLSDEDVNRPQRSPSTG